MPVIRVEMFKRTQEQKINLVKELTEAFGLDIRNFLQYTTRQ